VRTRPLYPACQRWDILREPRYVIAATVTLMGSAKPLLVGARCWCGAPARLAHKATRVYAPTRTAPAGSPPLP